MQFSTAFRTNVFFNFSPGLNVRAEHTLSVAITKQRPASSSSDRLARAPAAMTTVCIPKHLARHSCKTTFLRETLLFAINILCIRSGSSNLFFTVMYSDAPKPATPPSTWHVNPTIISFPRTSALGLGFSSVISRKFTTQLKTSWPNSVSRSIRGVSSSFRSAS